MSARLLVGRVRRWERAYGFIDADGRRFFVHVSEIDNRTPLALGEVVVFTPEAAPRGPRAIRVVRLPARCPKCDAPVRRAECRSCGFRLGPS